MILYFEFPLSSVWAGPARLVLSNGEAEVQRLCGGSWEAHPSENASEVAGLVVGAIRLALLAELRFAEGCDNAGLVVAGLRAAVDRICPEEAGRAHR